MESFSLSKDCVDHGAAIASGLKVGVGLLMRDVSRTFDECTQRCYELCSYFEDYSICVVENDSKDSTPHRLARLSKQDPKVSINCSKQRKRKWPMIRSAHRGRDMAAYRNTCKEMLLQGSNADIFVIVDSDLAWWSVEGVLSSMKYMTEFSGMASNGLRKDKTGWVQCDAWAYRTKTWLPLQFKDVKNRVFEVGKTPIEVLSAFGGLAVYTREVLEKCKYAGGDCEHVAFHRQMQESGLKMGLNPSQVCVYSF